MRNPVEDFLAMKKQAFGFSDIGKALKSDQARDLGGKVLGGLGAGAAFAGGGAAIAGGAQAVGKMYDAATKTRDFHRMLAVNPDLRELREEDPKAFNHMYSALRTMNTEFAQEPMVAGAYMRQAMAQPAETRGMVAVEAQNAARPGRPSPMMDAALRGMAAGLGSFKQESPKPLPQGTETFTEQQVYNPSTQEWETMRETSQRAQHYY